MVTELFVNWNTNTVMRTIFLLCTLVVPGDVSAGTYEENSMCGFEDQKCSGCATLATESSVTDIHCARLCQSSPSCQGIVLTDDNTCHLHYSCEGPDNPYSCGVADRQYQRYLLRPATLSTCQNGGIWNEISKSCSCSPYWTGERCERRLRSCRELKDLGYPDGVHWVDMNVMGRPSITKVKCQLDASSIRTYVSYNNGTSNYNATFQEYKDGFYRDDASFWLGLDNMHMITRSTTVRGVLNILINDVIVVEYIFNFKIDNECADYELSYSSINPVSNDLGTSIGLCISRLFKFSTWDNDQDDDAGVNMAAIAGSGWWFNTRSHYCNFNGKKPLDSNNSPENIAVPGTDLSYNSHGKDFQFSEFYLEE